MSLEEVVESHNADVFLREFTYGTSRFQPQGGSEVEFCDGAIWIDQLLILLQLKERSVNHDTLVPQSEAQWFRKKVSKRSIDQFDATLRHLRQERTLPLKNVRGQTIDISKAGATEIHLVSVYSSSEALPEELAMIKGRISERVGFVHFLHVNDYINVCLTLHTPYEISDYLAFRENFVRRNEIANQVWEKALLGKYLSDTDDSSQISDQYAEFVDRLIDDRNQFSIGNLLRSYLDRIAWGNCGTEYHAILRELAKLRRNMLREFRKRLLWAMNKCKESAIHLPSRFYPVDLDCSYIVIPLPASQRGNWRKHLEAYTHLCKYDLKSQKCIGMTVATDSTADGQYLVNWLYLACDWAPDANIDKILSEHRWFRETWFEELGKYAFKCPIESA